MITNLEQLLFINLISLAPNFDFKLNWIKLTRRLVEQIHWRIVVWLIRKQNLIRRKRPQLAKKWRHWRKAEHFTDTWTLRNVKTLKTQKIPERETDEATACAVAAAAERRLDASGGSCVRQCPKIPQRAVSFYLASESRATMPLDYLSPLLFFLLCCPPALYLPLTCCHTPAAPPPLLSSCSLAFGRFRFGFIGPFRWTKFELLILLFNSFPPSSV